MSKNDPEYQKAYIRKHYQDNKEYYKEKSKARKAKVLPYRREVIRRYKVKYGCVDCGYNQHPEAIDFDHLPQYEKSFNVSQALHSLTSWSKVKAEIRKCALRCANCHRVKTVQRRIKATN